MNEKIRVAFFADILIKDFDGASRTMYQLIERIPNDLFEFKFFTGVPPKKDIGYEVMTTPTVPIPFNSTYKMALPQLKKRALRKALTEYAPDIIHIASPSALGNFALNYGNKNDIPVLTIYHTHFISYIPYYFRMIPFLISPVEKYVINNQKSFYNNTSLMYVPTKTIMEELKGYGLDGSLMKLWQRGINQKLFNPSKKDIPFIQKIVGNKKPNIIFASRLVWEKNLQTLIKIYQESVNNGDKYNFIVAGDGVAAADLKKAMPTAYMLGTVSHEDLAKLYASSDVFVFPSISETYGNVVVEAMASGCPPVIAAGGGSQSLVDHNITGYLCSPNDQIEYLKYIDLIISNDEKKKSLVQEGLEYVKDLDWNSLAERYFEDLKKLASSEKYN